MRSRLICILLGLVLILLSDQNLFVAADSFKFPVMDYSVIQTFGNHNQDYPCTTTINKRHTGEDIAGTANTTAVYSIAEGQVMFAQKRDKCETNWGYVLVIEHTLPNNSKICSIYGHLDDNTVLVKEKDFVSNERSIGYIGHFSCWQDHLHFGLYNGSYQASIGSYPIWLNGYMCPDKFPGQAIINGQLIQYIKPSDYINSFWNFEAEDACDGWHASPNVEGYSVNRSDSDHNGVYYIDPGASDPYIFSPPLSISFTKYDTIKICMASNAPDGMGAIYFTTSTSPEWGEDKKVSLTVNNEPGGFANYYEYKIFMGDHPKWQGTITGLRIDPADHGISGSNVDTIGIDYIRLIKSEAIPTITSSLEILQSPPYYVGNTITAQFTITNKGLTPIIFDILTVGGRNPDDEVADFGWDRNINLGSNKIYEYKSSLTLSKIGNYHFFCAYKPLDSDWNPAISTEEGINNTIDLIVKPSLPQHPVLPAIIDLSDDLSETPQYTLEVKMEGFGAKEVVVSNPYKAIICNNDCSQVYDAGTEITLIATPKPEASFIGWSGDDNRCSNSGSCEVEINKDITLTAKFEKKKYTVIAIADSNGSISPSGDFIVDYGSSQTFTIIPNQGYQVAEVLVNNEPVFITGDTYSLSNIYSNYEIEVCFEPNDQFTLVDTGDAQPAGKDGTPNIDESKITTDRADDKVISTDTVKDDSNDESTDETATIPSNEKDAEDNNKDDPTPTIRDTIKDKLNGCFITTIANLAI